MKRFVEFDDATLAAHNNHQKKHVLAELDSLVQSSVFVCPVVCGSKRTRFGSFTSAMGERGMVVQGW